MSYRDRARAIRMEGPVLVISTEPDTGKVKDILVGDVYTGELKSALSETEMEEEEK